MEVAGPAGTVPVPRRRERCLLGVLLLELHRVVPVDRLADLLWDGKPPERARHAIHTHVSRLRAALAAAGGGSEVELHSVGNGYRLSVDPDTVDVHRFRALLDRAAANPDLACRITQLRAALDLWRGPTLGNAASDRLRDRLCAGLHEQHVAVIEDLAATSLLLRREREILPELARAAAEHPGREGLIELHMQALYQAGRKVDALAVYARARGYLVDELGLDPSPKLRDLHQAILRDQLAVPAPPDPAAGTPAAGTPAVSIPATGTSPTGVRATRTAAVRPDQTRQHNARPHHAGPGLPSSRSVVPRQLPADVASFIGRTAQLDHLDSLLPAGTGGGAAGAVIAVISGTAGVGKSALAVHWAHRVAPRFPDGQLYLNLRGFDSGGTPMAAAHAIRVLLDGLPAAPRQIPASLDAQVGLYRSLLAGRRILIVIDNARDAGQVHPLLPGTPGCVAVVTSRDQLSGVVAGNGAHPLQLDVFTVAEARQLLDQRIGADRVAAAPDAIAEIINRCARLPLALAIVAARAAAYPAFPVRALAQELRETRTRLGAPGGRDPVAEVWAALDASHRTLPAGAARLLRQRAGAPVNGDRAGGARRSRRDRSAKPPGR